LRQCAGDDQADKDADARMELVKIRNELTVLKKKQILADLDKGSEKYQEITDKLNAVASAMKKTADAIKAASDAAALLAKIAALLAGAVGPKPSNPQACSWPPAPHAR
jgi:methyl-accepting chemotaxis protein